MTDPERAAPLGDVVITGLVMLAAILALAILALYLDTRRDQP